MLYDVTELWTLACQRNSIFQYISVLWFRKNVHLRRFFYFSRTCGILYFIGFCGRNDKCQLANIVHTYAHVRVYTADILRKGISSFTRSARVRKAVRKIVRDFHLRSNYGLESRAKHRKLAECAFSRWRKFLVVDTSQFCWEFRHPRFSRSCIACLFMHFPLMQRKSTLTSNS